MSGYKNQPYEVQILLKLLLICFLFGLSRSRDFNFYMLDIFSCVILNEYYLCILTMQSGHLLIVHPAA